MTKEPALAYRLALAGAVAVVLSGCDQIGNPFDSLYERRAGPDEFAVLERAPLEMPESIDLPEPRLGERSQLEPNPERDAVIALLGPSAVDTLVAPSAGEEALLSAANAASAGSDVRNQLEADAVAAVEDAPYEPPSLVELFTGRDEAPVDLIDPAAEARRLQRQGIAPAPVDPNSLPDAVAGPEEEEILPENIGNDPLKARRGT